MNTDQKTQTDFNRAVRAQLLEKALKAAQFEARHQGPFNWSGKEIYPQGFDTLRK
jgi:hypothetical protein